MAGVTYGGKGGRVRVQNLQDKGRSSRSAEEVVREIKASQQSGGEEYRERALSLHGLICGRCGREFETANRHLLTVHHKDGNHHNNPPDGSNWENLCAYCHEDVHSRGALGDYMEGTAASREQVVVYRDEAAAGGMGALADKLKKALEKKRS
ncbi:MAG: YajD family HNH nuclease [Proteobacteria bacterium]|nr:YajD family HNH nuclease [Pseudomonadota bacterium]MBU1745081.1 YajD family HNH nuclease [Pseudomonadota bacterium]MBU1966197.1 YajD family HNH nuclease [Pseudomonadota bacterium]